jgi:hypothetical protein
MTLRSKVPESCGVIHEYRVAPLETGPNLVLVGIGSARRGDAAADTVYNIM